eukprot:1580016-Rhodomonas_salina.1
MLHAAQTAGVLCDLPYLHMLSGCTVGDVMSGTELLGEGQGAAIICRVTNLLFADGSRSVSSPYRPTYPLCNARY